MPNTTAVMQETYQKYGRFKSQYRCKLELLVEKCVHLDMSVSVPQHKHGLLVFGGVDEDTGLELESAFKLGFSCRWCIDSWAKLVLPLSLGNVFMSHRQGSPLILTRTMLSW